MHCVHDNTKNYVDINNFNCPAFTISMLLCYRICLQNIDSCASMLSIRDYIMNICAYFGKLFKTQNKSVLYTSSHKD